jgi:hypothetical protein
MDNTMCKLVANILKSALLQGKLVQNVKETWEVPSKKWRNLVAHLIALPPWFDSFTM